MINHKGARARFWYEQCETDVAKNHCHSSYELQLVRSNEHCQVQNSIFLSVSVYAVPEITKQGDGIFPSTQPSSWKDCPMKDRGLFTSGDFYDHCFRSQHFRILTQSVYIISMACENVAKPSFSNQLIWCCTCCCRFRRHSRKLLNTLRMWGL